MTEQHDATGGDNTTYGEAYHYADNFLQKGDKEAAESGAFYARIRHERYLNEQAILQGQSTSSLLMPGLEIRVQGDDAPAVFRKGVLITGVTASAARDRSYELTFTAIPYSERYGYRPALIPRPVMAGTLPARVTSTVKNDIYAHIDKDGATGSTSILTAIRGNRVMRACGYASRARMRETPTACTCRCWRERKSASPLRKATRTDRISPG